MKEEESQENALVVFQGKGIRRIWYEDEWHFSVIDIIAVLTEQSEYQKARKYWNKLSQRLREEGSEVVTDCHRLKLTAEDGKLRPTDCSNTKTLFRIIQSIPSPKAEPFKQWLAKVGYERVQEIENPELAQKRMKELYQAKGYSEAWIEKRVRGIAVRDELTDEWLDRGIQHPIEFAILTAEISKAAFGLTPSEYRELKGLERQNLRDHMTDLELIFTMLGEASTTEIARSKDTQGFPENKDAAQKGGKISGNARNELEKETGKNVVTSGNYLETPEKKKKLK
ncbi:MAG: Bro-N domain-containing protein [Thermoplasmata archaeon]|nr:Bro-N domain-containing protein [Thermoplasmata archaeon]